MSTLAIALIRAKLCSVNILMVSYPQYLAPERHELATVALFISEGHTSATYCAGASKPYMTHMGQ